MRIKLVFLLSLLLFPLVLVAENGSDLWLRYSKINKPIEQEYVKNISSLVVTESGSVIESAANEWKQAFRQMTGTSVREINKPKANSLVLITSSNKLVSDFNLASDLKACGSEGFIIRTLNSRAGNMTVIAANSEAGVLYGTFRLIRKMQMGESLSDLNIQESPKYDLRVLNHWDNLDGTVERGYAGYSIWWNRDKALDQLRSDYVKYARANASVGINGTVINNVNANPNVLTAEYIQLFAEYADILRPYNIKIYMSVNFASPAVLDGLETSDPLNADVIQWWENRVKEIYKSIPDFGGFLVKANSEGQPGPMDFGRTHVDGANMLAKALKPYNGIVMWRAFVYEPEHPDRAGQAYAEFMPLDGKFDDNVIVQVKNGPVDFQPREPFSPLFGAMLKTPVMIEFQITQEYLGFSDHLAYLSTMWKEVLDADTYAKGVGSTVAKTTDGTLFNHELSAISGVANIGRDTNWTGHDFAQANWYAYGRLAWDYDLSSDEIAREWAKMTFTDNPEFVESTVNIMMRSREAVVNYMTPLGLHHLMGWSHHYGPEPWTEIEGARPDWLPSYYHRASTDGIGFNRSSTGTNSVDQYYSPLKELYDNVATCPENLLLWFHHLPWDYRLVSGLTLWDAIVYKYYEGVEETRYFQKQWDRLEGSIDQERFLAVQKKLRTQTREAVWWRDACVLYFQTFSKMAIPDELERPIHDLGEMKKLKFDMKHHN